MPKCYGRARKGLRPRRPHAVGRPVFSESLDLTSRQRLFGHAFFPSAFGAGAMVESTRSFE
jgi:hypothetical protein